MNRRNAVHGDGIGGKQQVCRSRLSENIENQLDQVERP